jgi:hypothetical protein
MRRTLATIILASAAFAAQGNEGVELSIRSKAAAGTLPVKQADAPFRTARDPMPELLLREELEKRGPRASCETAATDLCYDLGDARVVYRPARQYMPQFEGLRAESISLRRDRIVLKYSFK